MYILKSKKTITGIALAAILVAGIFTFIPSASADLTALDKIGTIINIITDIQNIVTEINDDLLKKKQFWQRVEEVDDASVTGVFGSCPTIAQEDCAFTVESIHLRNVTDTGFPSGSIPALAICVDPFVVCTILPEPDGNGIGNDVLVRNKVGIVGSSVFVAVVHEFFVFGEPATGIVEYNGQKPQDMELIFISFPSIFSGGEGGEAVCFEGTGDNNEIPCPDTPEFQQLPESIAEAMSQLP